MKVDSSGFRSEHGLTCLAWNESQFEPIKIAVGGYSRRAVVLAIDKNHVKEVDFIPFILFLTYECSCILTYERNVCWESISILFTISPGHLRWVDRIISSPLQVENLHSRF